MLRSLAVALVTNQSIFSTEVTFAPVAHVALQIVHRLDVANKVMVAIEDPVAFLTYWFLLRLRLSAAVRSG